MLSFPRRLAAAIISRLQTILLQGLDWMLSLFTMPRPSLAVYENFSRLSVAEKQSHSADWNIEYSMDPLNVGL